ncbi:hypothetical protein NQ317_005604 [Molorchus minor]|uniref:Uncharacterized protein n=1 Tax=Molorchus minor TaxID=1323400 RepID=A0ABQ9K6C5_9CUCU|nr:hypothetical protein NQ317_005604 [Molorchus minor]
MKAIILFLLVGLCAFVVSSSTGRTVDKTYLKRERDILLILKNINQPSYYQEFVNIGKTYDIVQNKDKYTDPDAVKQFLQYYKYGLLPRGVIFSAFNREHLQEAIAVFKLLFYSKDYEAFYNTAVWARQNLNEGLFLYSFTVAVVHRQDTKDLVLPPIYETYPYYFVNSEVIKEAYRYKQQRSGPKLDEGYDGYTIYSNYSGYYLNLHPEQSLSYYMEDIGILSYYYYYNVYYPFWMNGKEFGFENTNRGEQYYFFYQQFLARYYLERLSNDFGEIPHLNWDAPIETPYYPSLEYPNGLEFPRRPQWANLKEYIRNYGQSWTLKGREGYGLLYVNDYERRIDDAIDSGYVWTGVGGVKVDLYSKEGFDILGNLIQSNKDSPNYKYYGAIWWIASHLLGYSYQPLDKFKLIPSALEHFETAPRDPVFYQLYKKIVLKFQRYYGQVPAYTERDLVFPGVQIKSFTVDKLTTFFDYFYSDLNNAVYFSTEEQQKSEFNVRVRQYRLNNKPFTFKVNVQSDKDTKSVVKVFLGPKYDEYGRFLNLTENRLNFVLIDYFVYDLKSGENIISRNSYDSYYYAPDAASSYELNKKVLGGTGGQDQLPKQNYFFFPRRYLLPIGSPSGVPYQFYVIVYPYTPKEGSPTTQYESYFYPYDGEQQFYDSRSLGYPFDRFINFEQMYYQIPNSVFYETKVYHKDYINVRQSD